MKKFLKKLLAFIGFAIVFYVSCLVALGFILNNKRVKYLNFYYPQGSIGYMNLRLKDIDNYEKIDILCIGSSHTYRGFDTRILKSAGFNSFNLGSTSQTHIQTNLLLRKYIPRLKPRVVIYEVYPIIFNFDGIESALDLIANDKKNILYLEMILNIFKIKVINTYIYDLFRELIISQPITDKTDILPYEKYINGGYVEKTTNYFYSAPIQKQKIVINPKQLKYFEKNIKFLKKNGIEYILVYAPITKKYYNSLENKQYFDSLMRTYGKYYNFNEMLDLEDTLHFNDKDHLNQQGVEIFNRKLIETIYKDFDIFQDKI